MEEDYVLNPFARLRAEDGGSIDRRKIQVTTCRRRSGWETTSVSRDDRPRLFAILETLMQANGAATLDLTDEDEAEVRAVGLWVRPDDVPRDVRFQVPIDDQSAAPPRDEFSADERIVHPSLTLEPPADVEVPALALHPGAIAWLMDPRHGVIGPVWCEPVEALLRSLKPGQAAPRLDESARRVLCRAGILVRRDEIASAAELRAAELLSARQALRTNGHAIVSRLVPDAQLAALQQYYRALVDEGVLRYGDGQVERRHAVHNEVVARMFLTALTPIVCDVVGEPVKPSYAYFASYRDGAVLANHRDRAQCEFSISFLIDYVPTPDGPSPWPLWVRREPDEVGVPLHQNVGDGIFYKGCELYHSRPALPVGHRSMHIFFHYVPAAFSGNLD
jgi:hypothetical protein